MPNGITKTKSEWTYTVAIGLLLVVMAMKLFRAEDPYNVLGLCLATCLIVIRPLPFGLWSATDWILAAMVGYESLSCFYTPCTVPAIRTTSVSVSVFMIYLMARKLLVQPRSQKIWMNGSLLLISTALLLALFSFFIFRKSVIEAGFSDTYPFRFLFRPLGYVTNVWAEILLGLLGYLCLAHRHAAVLIFLVFCAILLSFSRGAYLATTAFLLLWLLWVKPTRHKWGVAVMALLAIVIVGVTFPTETGTTVRMNATVSQRESTQSRIEATHSTWETVGNHLWFGKGNESYTFAIDPILNQDSTKSYTSFAPNLPVLLLVEKGIVGLGFYLLLGTTIASSIWKRRHEAEAQVIGCTLLALAVKEMSQATLPSTPFALLIVALLLAYLQKDRMKKERDKENYGGNRERLFSCFLLMGNVAVLCMNCVCLHDESGFRQGYGLLETGNIKEASRTIEKVSDRFPCLIQKGLFYTECHRKTLNTVYVAHAGQALKEAIRLQPEDVQLPYLLARLYLQCGKWKEAADILQKLSSLYPKNSLYLLSLAESYYQVGEKDKALSCFSSSILYTPQLLKLDKIEDLQQTDTAFCRMLHEKLLRMKPSPSASATDYARLGYIAHHLHREQTAQAYLKHAVELLPNLSTPWLLLGENKKYLLLNYGAFGNRNESEENPQKTITEQWLLMLSYKAKYQAWYGMKWN